MSLPFHSAPPGTTAGLGIALTTSYGTVSIRQDDGSFDDVARIEADDAYINMMRRLSTSDAAHTHPPYSSTDEMWSDSSRHFQRAARKWAGQPASPDVAILARMLSALYDASRIATSRPIVAISYPALTALYPEDIADAAEYLHLHLPLGHSFYPPRTIAAAYAGHGLGLPAPSGDREHARIDALNLPLREVLLVEYTPPSLLLHLRTMRESVDLGIDEPHTWASFDLGAANADTPGYADSVKDTVLGLFRDKYAYGDAPDAITVIVTGECAASAAVQGPVKAAIKEFGAKAMVVGSRPEYIAARGAAEMAWREQAYGSSAVDVPL